MKSTYLFILICFLSCSGDSVKQDNQEISILAGTWLLTEIQGETTALAPENEEILITFKNGEFTGETERNEYGGDYSVQLEHNLILGSFYGTEVATTEWEDLFVDSFLKAYKKETNNYKFSFIIKSEELELKIQDEESTTIHFSRIN